VSLCENKEDTGKSPTLLTDDDPLGSLKKLMDESMKTAIAAVNDDKEKAIASDVANKAEIAKLKASMLSLDNQLKKCKRESKKNIPIATAIPIGGGQDTS
jgi:phosphoribosyl-ATP pyrophosphohydrolase